MMMKNYCVKNRHQILEVTKNTREDKPFFWNKQGNIRTKICLTTKEKRNKMKKKTFEKLLK